MKLRRLKKIHIHAELTTRWGWMICTIWPDSKSHNRRHTGEYMITWNFWSKGKYDS